MKKLVLILPILVSLLIFVGFAAAETQERVNSTNFILNVDLVDFESSACSFAKAADDGGALGEKAICRAMLENPQNDPSEISRIITQTTVQQIPTARPVVVTSLTAIREDEA